MNALSIFYVFDSIYVIVSILILLLLVVGVAYVIWKLYRKIK
ncbi:hypothetical protein LVIS_1892 [Levilactobacillus brevis ATCC 367]|uniref:Uncharacterized protein n=1 Tax=Levilactobacillus brevis (strain ATCC 367 / BCRC 12310 / CIP 105137 / JCM 1170 / LMG 11437 / NCIMB 947 / NCTC 947) TaxID=387344 RepID=Q03PB9_LEVBA|nr:hypothetical protein LVIS_1892 [Levilactobacillus brevis ATCC 367]